MTILQLDYVYGNYNDATELFTGYVYHHHHNSTQSWQTTMTGTRDALSHCLEPQVFFIYSLFTYSTNNSPETMCTTTTIVIVPNRRKRR